MWCDMDILIQINKENKEIINNILNEASNLSNKTKCVGGQA